MKELIISHLRDARPWGASLHWFGSIDSTNTQARLMAAAGAPEGTVLLADYQTGGRGRRGRSFHSPAGTGIYMSVILRPQCAPTELMHLTCATAVAACDAIESVLGVRPGIKWTNDLVLGGKKIAGILTELAFTPTGMVDCCIVGIGLNCCQQEADFPPEIRDIAGSLAWVTGQSVDRARLAAALMDAMRILSARLLTHKAETLDRYRRDCITLGREVSVVRGDEVRHGTALDIDAEGALLVQYADGTRQYVNSGEVSIRGMYGYL